MKSVKRKEFKVTPIKIVFSCAKCDVPLDFTGSVKLCSPPLYVHVCPECGESFDLKEESGKVVYKKGGKKNE